MQIDEVDYTPDKWENSIFCTDKEVHSTKRQAETKVEERCCQSTHAKVRSMEAQEEMRNPSTHANKSEACNNMIANNKTSPDIYCANVSSKQPRKSKGVRPRKNTAELTVGRGIELRQIPDYLKLA